MLKVFKFNKGCLGDYSNVRRAINILKAGGPRRSEFRETGVSKGPREQFMHMCGSGTVSSVTLNSVHGLPCLVYRPPG